MGHGSKSICISSLHHCHLGSVPAAGAGVFAILVNKFLKIMKIFQQLDRLRSQWVL